MDSRKALQVLGMAVLYPDNHYQGTWVRVPEDEEIISAATMRSNPTSCGTTLCFAGFAAAMYSPEDAVFTSADEENFFVPDPNGDCVLTHDFVYSNGDLEVETYDPMTHCCGACQPRYRKVDIMEFASETLELEPAQATALFDGYNSVDKLKRLVRYLINHPHADAIDLAYV